jgi:hypothetical protein
MSNFDDNNMTEVTASELETMTFEPLRWIVPGLLPEGLAILAAAAKTGKSWFALDIAIGTATGTHAFGGAVSCKKGNVLFGAFEDDARRVQSRLKLAQGDRPNPGDSLTIWTKMPRLEEGGIEALDGWLTEESNPGLVVIDLYEKVRGARRSYQADYKQTEPLKRLAHKHGVAILLIMHVTRKVRPETPLDSIYPGVAGSAGTIVILAASQDEGAGYINIYTTGKDVEQSARSLKFISTGQLRFADGSNPMGDADIPQAETSRQLIVSHLTKNGASTPAEISEATRINPNYTRQLLFQLRKTNTIAKNGTRYSIRPPEWNEVTYPVRFVARADA